MPYLNALALAIFLGLASADDRGPFGFVMLDDPSQSLGTPHKQSLVLGDTLLFCTRDRLGQLGGAYGLQAVKHGVQRITHGSRLVLGVPFHEYR